MRRLQFGKHGLTEDPRGLHVTWVVGFRHYLAEVIGCYRCESLSTVMLQTRYFNGGLGPEVAAAIVQVLEREMQS